MKRNGMKRIRHEAIFIFAVLFLILALFTACESDDIGTETQTDDEQTTEAMSDADETTEAQTDNEQTTEVVPDADETTEAQTDNEQTTKAVSDADETTKPVTDTKDENKTTFETKADTDDKGSKTKVKVTAVSIKAEKSKINVGEKITLTATVSPDNADSKDIAWSVSDKKIANVTSDGVFTALAAGNVTVTATAKDGSGISGRINIQVENQPKPKNLVAKIVVTADKGTLNIGETASLIATVTPNNADNKSVTWSVSDPSVADIDANGKLTAKKAGKVTVTATAKDGSGVKGTMEITSAVPKDYVTQLKIVSEVNVMYVGETFDLICSVYPTAVGKELKWTYRSDVKDIVTYIYPDKWKCNKPGVVTITAAATDGSGVTTSITVTIKEEIKKGNLRLMMLPSNGFPIKVGDTVQFSAEIQIDDDIGIGEPTWAPYTDELIWSVSDPALAAINSNGLLQCKGIGFVEVVAKTKDGSMTARDGISIQSAKISMLMIHRDNAAERNGTNENPLKPGDTLQFSYIVNPEGQKIVWISQDPSVATIDENGLLTAHSPGYVLIDAYTEDGSGHSQGTYVTVK